MSEQHTSHRLLKATIFLFTVTASLAVAQTRIVVPNNKYTPAQDVELGQQAAKEVEQQLPLLRDESIETFVDRIGRRLVQVTPSELQHREFQYSFKVINVREINAFALPGGPMYVNRGMIQAAAVEGEVAGVMAHELSHVILRHGTAGATKEQPFAIGAIAGAIAGAIIGGNVGQVVAQGTQFGLGTYFLRYSREYEKQADLLGVQLMALAGYNPLDLMHMFQTIEKQSGAGGPQFLSDHPNPGDRETYIAEEASHLRIEGRAADTREFASVQDRLRGMSPAPTTEQVTRQGKQTPTRSGQPAPEGRNIGRVAPPSSQSKSYTEGNLFSVNVPDKLERGSLEFVGEVRARRRLWRGAGPHGLHTWRGDWLYAQRNPLAPGSDPGIHRWSVAVESLLARSRRLPEHESVWSQRAHDDTQQRLRGDRPGRKDHGVHDTAARQQSLLLHCRRAAGRVERLSTVVSARGAIDPPHRLSSAGLLHKRALRWNLHPHGWSSCRLVARGRDDAHRADLELTATQHAAHRDSLADFPRERERFRGPDQIRRAPFAS